MVVYYVLQIWVLWKCSALIQPWHAWMFLTYLDMQVKYLSCNLRWVVGYIRSTWKAFRGLLPDTKKLIVWHDHVALHSLVGWMKRMHPPDCFQPRNVSFSVQWTLAYPNSFYATTWIIRTACFNHYIIKNCFVVLPYFAACAVLCNCATQQS